MFIYFLLPEVWGANTCPAGKEPLFAIYVSSACRHYRNSLPVLSHNPYTNMFDCWLPLAFEKNLLVLVLVSDNFREEISEIQWALALEAPLLRCSFSSCCLCGLFGQRPFCCSGASLGLSRNRRAWVEVVLQMTGHFHSSADWFKGRLRTPRWVFNLSQF